MKIGCVPKAHCRALPPSRPPALSLSHSLSTLAFPWSMLPRLWSHLVVCQVKRQLIAWVNSLPWTPADEHSYLAAICPRFLSPSLPLSLALSLTLAIMARVLRKQQQASFVDFSV